MPGARGGLADTLLRLRWILPLLIFLFIAGRQIIQWLYVESFGLAILIVTDVLVYGVLGSLVVWWALTAIARDLRRHEQADAAARQHEQYYASITRESADAILSLDTDGMIQAWSRGAEQIFGYSAAEIIGKHFSILVPDEIRAQGEIEHLARMASEKGYIRNYETERFSVTARDGTPVPVSMVYRKGLKKDGRNPLLLYGYGAYGNSTDPVFYAGRLSLIDRGFIYAIAHVRGGQEMGRKWYEAGKLLNKMNTFTDFIDCAKGLIAAGYTSAERICAQGESAGGLLVAAAVNMEPSLFRAVIAGVPWVDVATSMLDETIPLVTFEYDEWGDPRRAGHFKYILSYSPYDNVRPVCYPAMLVTAGLHDTQVAYWEPAKWVAKMRALKTCGNPLLLLTNMAAGHGGSSGRYGKLERIALEYAFLIEQTKSKEPSNLQLGRIK